MLSPRYLDGLSDEIADIYAQLEADILADMARRLAKLGKITEATKWQAQLLAETGALKKDVNRIIKKYDPAIQKELKAIYNDALIKNARSNNRIFEEALGHGVSDINAQVMLASIQKTHSDLSRLTITTAYTTEQQFVQQANAAYMQVVTGAVDYDSAMKSACNNLAKQGITGVHYRNGKPVRLSIEAAVRMNVLTGVNQTASAVTMSNCEELGCDLVETSAHIGARPEHEAWQGEVFSISGTNPKYRPFSVCGLGTIEGICGINCRHSYYPYFEGMENHYTTSELDEMADQTVTYNGKEMTRYEGEEKLRSMERTIRQYKRRAITQEAAGLDNTAAREKIGEWQAKARDFTKQTGIARDSARELVGTINGKQPRGIIPPKPEPAPKPTPKATPTPTPKATSKPAPKNTLKLQSSNFTDAFNTKTNAKSTAELVRYINSKESANQNVVELFNRMNDASLLKSVELSVNNSINSHYLEHTSSRLKIVLNKLVSNDPNIIGKAGTNIHEIGHLFDVMTRSSTFGQTSTRIDDVVKKARKYIKNGAELPDEITKLFGEKIRGSAAIRNKITSEGNAKIKALGEVYNRGGMSYSAYYKEYKAIKKAINLEYDAAVRDYMDGVDALMDIYDALSEGQYMKNGVVSFGHGVSYYSEGVYKQSSEIWANYTRLSITNPELMDLLRKYEPDLVAGLDETAVEILNELRGAK